MHAQRLLSSIHWAETVPFMATYGTAPRRCLRPAWSTQVSSKSIASSVGRTSMLRNRSHPPSSFDSTFMAAALLLKGCKRWPIFYGISRSCITSSALAKLFLQCRAFAWDRGRCPAAEQNGSRGDVVGSSLLSRLSSAFNLVPRLDGTGTTPAPRPRPAPLRGILTR